MYISFHKGMIFILFNLIIPILFNLIIPIEHLIESEQDFDTLGKNFEHIMYVLMFYRVYFFLFNPILRFAIK